MQLLWWRRIPISLILGPGLWLLGSAACRDSSEKTALHSVVDGRWSTACMGRQDLFSAYRVELELAEAHRVTRTETYFADAACDQSLAAMQYSGSYELMVTTRDYIYAIDLYYDEQSIAALNSAGQERLEQHSFCGRQHWPLAEGQSPADFDPNNCLAVGPVPLKNLNLVQVTRGHSLDFGSDIANENDRPVEVQEEPPLNFLQKQSH